MRCSRESPGYNSHNGDGSGVHHRIVGAVRYVVENDRIEWISRRLDADFIENGRPAVAGKGIPIGERFRDRLNRERNVGVTDGENAAVGGGDSDSEITRVRPGEFRDISRHLPGING